MFTDKVIIVTGAAGPVGTAVARMLAERGARIAAVDALGPPLVRVIESLTDPELHLALPGVDLSDPVACEEMAAQAARLLGGLDGVAATPAGFWLDDLAETVMPEWEQVFRLTVKTTWNVFRAAAPHLRQSGGGALVGVGGSPGARQMAGHAAMKSALQRLTQSLAEELRLDGIRVNAVLQAAATIPPTRTAASEAATLRRVRAAEVAGAMLSLLSESANGVTGTVVSVD